MATVIPPGYCDEIEACFAQSSPAIYCFLLAYTCRDRGLAEDLVQETFLRAAVRWGELRDLDSEPRLAWLRQVAANAAVDAFRRNGTVRKERPGVSLFQPRESDPCREALTAMALQRLVEVIERMPQRRRLAAFLKWRCGWKNGEIADSLQITPGAASQLLTAAEALLRRELQGYVPFDLDESTGQGEGG